MLTFLNGLDLNPFGAYRSSGGEVGNDLLPSGVGSEYEELVTHFESGRVLRS